MSNCLRLQHIYLLALCLTTSGVWGQNFTDMTAQNNFGVTGFNRGIAIGDFDNDGLEDIYVSRLSGANLLYKNTGGFHFQEVGADFGVRHMGSTTCSVWFDLENDGDLDLFLANLFEPNVLYRNDNDSFTDISAAYGIGTEGNARSVNAVDFDNDGDLDIYVAQVLDQNILWRNDGGASLTDVTSVAGIDDTGRSLGAVFLDYDLDGDQDLYQTRDGSDPNLFWRNNGDGTFTEISAECALDYVGSGMGADIGDVNGDGYPDIYLTNLFENRLYINDRSGGFAEISESAGVDDIGMGWGTVLFDHNNNGRIDIYLANDSYFGVNGQDNLYNKLFVNKGNNLFYSTDDIGNIQNTFGSYGVACGDLDQDGRLDLVIANNGPNDGNQLFRNTSATGHFISFHLIGETSNTQGIGSRVALYAGDQVQVDFVTAGSGYASQSSSRVHFGLGDTTSVDSVVVEWPSGIRQKILYPEVDAVYPVPESQNTIVAGPVVWTEPPFPGQFDDVTVFFNAQEGNGALAGYAGDVYAHTGVITSESSNSNDWRHVVGDWGTDDPDVLMTRVDDDLYTLSYNIQEYYGVNAGEEVYQMAFVFRNVDGGIVGRDADGSDIFTDVYPDTQGLFVTVLSPGDDIMLEEGDSVLIQVQANDSVRFTIRDNADVIFDDSTDMAEFFLHPSTTGRHDLEILATKEPDTVRIFRRFYVVQADRPLLDPPDGVRDGLNYMSDTSYVFQLYAPGKSYVFLLCPANDYRAHPDFRMHQSMDSSSFWIELPGSHFAGVRNTYAYLIEGAGALPDPYSELVLDPVHDGGVPPEVLDGLPSHPGSHLGIVTVFDSVDVDYAWTHPDFEKPRKTDLVIYELLVRDLLHDHSFASLKDTLDYFERLGVNAIELMPVNEFEGNISWGYNPSLHMAVDKYYGSREQLKRFIDEAHSRGIAVILDVVFNHAFSQSPLAQMYWDDVNFRPAPDNPWLNVTPRHPFTVGYDFNHESAATRKWVKRNLEHWITEFHFDGFRFDLSKGFTQKFSGDNIGLFEQYDASRITILKEYADFIWSLDSTAYIILEHFAENSEEIELSGYGMMIWANQSHGQFAEAAMGYVSDLEGADYTARGWNHPHLVAYMESHDEERITYKVLEYGDAEGDYNTQEMPTALRRVEAASAIFYSIPGPKMLWQFGELGYDYSINRCPDGTMNHDCRVDPKPIRWDYLNIPDRERLRKVTAALIHLKTHYPTFASTDFTFSDGNFYLKTVHLNHPDMDAVTLANYRVINSDITPRFQYPGTWYEYFTGDSLEVVDVNEKLTFLPGEYRIYTSKRIAPPDGYFTTSTREAKRTFDISVTPNPVRTDEAVSIALEEPQHVQSVTLTHISGYQIPVGYVRNSNRLVLRLSSLAAGIYIVRIETKDAIYAGKLVVTDP